MQKAVMWVHGQNDSSSIRDGTSFTSDTQPAVLFFFLIIILSAVSVHKLFVTSQDFGKQLF